MSERPKKILSLRERLEKRRKDDLEQVSRALPNNDADPAPPEYPRTVSPLSENSSVTTEVLFQNQRKKPQRQTELTRTSLHEKKDLAQIIDAVKELREQHLSVEEIARELHEPEYNIRTIVKNLKTRGEIRGGNEGKRTRKVADLAEKIKPFIEAGWTDEQIAEELQASVYTIISMRRWIAARYRG